MTPEKRQEIINNIDLLNYIENQGYKARGNRKGYIITPCPSCKSIETKKDKGHFVVYPDTNSYSSFTDCCKGGNIFDYLEEIEGLNKPEAISKAESLAGIKNDFKATREPQRATEGAKGTNTPPRQPEALKNDFKAYYKELEANDKEPAIKYLTEQRGIKKEAIKNILYDKKFNSVIFPVNENHCIYRSINQDSKGNKAGSILDIYNKDLLKDNQLKEIFITESIIDGLSLNKEFISLNSVSNKEKLIEAIKQGLDKAKDKLFILALDNDKGGEEATEHLIKEFENLNIKYTVFSFNRKYKDINEYLKAESEALENQIKNKSYLKPDLVSNYLDQFLKDIEANKHKEAIKTGFNKLDDNLDGGFYPGLYVIGAISSLGKTTFIQQITDNIAFKGQDILFFSLEMSKFEMVGKSLSRLTFESIKTRTEAVTTRQILKNSFNKEVLVSSGAGAKYESISNHLSIIEGGFNTNLNDVKSKIENYIELTGAKPVVVIDYLQILQAGDNGTGTEKQKIDYLVTELKRISRDYGLTVIVISSFNRENYLSGVGFESFKESGAIEYTADVVFGLQLEAVESLKNNQTITEKRDIINQAKEATPRKIELICLKNRNGKSYFKVSYEFYSKFNYFLEV